MTHDRGLTHNKFKPDKWISLFVGLFIYCAGFNKLIWRKKNGNCYIYIYIYIYILRNMRNKIAKPTINVFNYLFI